MFGDIKVPESLSKPELDELLAKGWFRMGQTIFTCNVLNFKREFYTAIWLRVDLIAFEEDSTFLKLKSRNNKFRVVFRPAEITSEKEILYSKYKTGISFDTASSLKSLLLDKGETTIFDTFEVCLYDQDKLVGVGFFDLGQKSAAGIVSFYDPDYKKHSLGKYLIYNKVSYCRKAGFEYFYPGYFAPHYPLFDYKLTIAKSTLEFYDIRAKCWNPIREFNSENQLVEVVSDKLLELEYFLAINGVQSARLKYEFYNANNVPHLAGMDLFDYPFFLFLHIPSIKDFVPILVYDIINEKYYIYKCASYFHDPNYNSTDGYYGSNLMKVIQTLFCHSNAEDVLKYIQSISASVETV